MVNKCAHKHTPRYVVVVKGKGESFLMRFATMVDALDTMAVFMMVGYEAKMRRIP